MFISKVDLFSVVVAGIFALVLGFVWMSVIWKVPYRKYMYEHPPGIIHQSPPKKVVITSFSIYILISILTAYVFAASLELWKAAGPILGYDSTSFGQGLLFTIFIWAGYTLPFSFGKRIWQFKSWHVVGIDASYEWIRFICFFLLFWYWQ